jgi:hypothetical protein
VKFTLYAIGVIWQELIPALGAIYEEVGNAVNGQPSPVSTFLVTVNTFFPLDLLVVYLSLLIQLWAFWNVYRLVKSWIPTLS